jgi:hypothetical protein
MERHASNKQLIIGGPKDDWLLDAAYRPIFWNIQWTAEMMWWMKYYDT